VPPTVHKRCLSVVFAALIALLAAAPAQAAKAPKVKAAYAVDSDRDGHVDGVSLKWSKKVRGGADAAAPFAFKVRGYRVTSVGTARGKSQRLQVAERRECDTGGSIRLSYRKRRGATPVRGARSHRLDMRRFDVPTPRITCAVTLDADNDARVDGIRVTYSREVKSDAQTGGRFLFSVGGYRVKAVKAARGRFVEIDVAEHDAPDSGATPVIGYNRPSKKKQRRFAVRAGKQGDAFSGTYQSTRDGVSPQLLAGQTGDNDADGLLDAMTLRFSEPVRTAGAAGLAVFGMKIGSAHADGPSIALSLFEGTARGDARPGAWVAGAGVTDLNGNAALRAAISPADGAAPVMTSAVTQDASGKAGYIDAVTVTFSEPVAHPRDAGGQYPFLLANRTVASVEPASGQTVQVRIAEASAPDTGDRPSVRYIPGSGFPVADVAGNQAAQGFVNPADRVAPVLISAVTGDTDSDGKIGSALLHFSEDVVHGAEGSGASFAVSGYGLTGADAASADEIPLTVTEKAIADSGAEPDVTYTRDGVEDVRDAAGNVTPTSSVGATDGARPVLLAVSTADVDDDGRLDRLASTWSEPLTHADDTSAPFAVSASGFSVSRVRAASGASLAIDLTEPSGYDTGSKPALTYLGDGASIVDAAGLEPEQHTWSGLTVDALDPRLISATTGDGDADGEIDSIAVRFSEAVVHAQEATPGSFTAGAFTISSAEAAAGDSVELKLLQSGTPDTGVRPAVGYTLDGVEDVRDATGNFAAAASIPQATDGARPVLMSAATADVDDNGRLDRVSTSWSEPLNHADDSSAPFPLAAEGLPVARVHAAAGQNLDVDLTEPAAADTGSAPDLTYTSGADPIRDVSGLEPAQVAHNGLTRDALPPRRVTTATADADTDGKIDAIDIGWSEDVTGSSATAPYTVAGRTLGGNASFSGARTRVPFAEDPAQFDTHDTPAVSYDSGAGDLHDIAEGTGDTTADAPTVAAETPLDKAVPVLVAAKTGDLSTPSVGNVPNGTIDAVLTTFSEPISHAVDGISPFTLNVAGRTETSVEADSGPGDRTLYVRVDEKADPDGGETPNVSVVAAGPVADHIKDQAAVPNEAAVMTFAGTTDEVRPVLMSAQLGERPGAGPCAKDATAGTDGKVDCVITTWSEDVVHAGDADGTYSLASSGWAIAAGGIGALGPSTTLDLPLTVDANPDRDRSGTTVTYNSAVDEPVVDAATPANDALDGTVDADQACKDTGREPNDAIFDTSHPALLPLSPAFERKCAFDDDWFRVSGTGSGHLEVSTRPVSGVDTKLALFDAGGSLVLGGTEEDGAAGEVDRLTFGGLTAGTYWARVQADDSATPQEGSYCLVYSNVATEPASCGPLAGQIVFTEAGFGNDKFLEIKNDSEVPVEMQGASAKVVVGTGASQRECWLVMPSVDVESILAPDEHVLIDDSAAADSFGCTTDDPADPNDPVEPPVIASLDPAGERLEMFANGAIDSVPLNGMINSNMAAHHSLQFVETAEDEDHQANDDVTRWCRTFAADSKAAVGDGCDEYRINEVLWRPTNSSATSDGRAFVELAGNIPAFPGSELLGGWVLRGVNGLTGDGTSDFVLGATASPRSNGTYVIADGVSGVTQVSQSDVVWDQLNLNSSLWPDGTGIPGPRGLQLLLPNPPSSPPCTGSVDAFGWTTTAQGFSTPLDGLRSCPGLEGQEYTNSTVGSSAARDNLSSAADTTYNAANDTTNNKIDFCLQAAPNPASLNIRPSC
jgi:hypothetical protein